MKEIRDRLTDVFAKAGRDTGHWRNIDIAWHSGDPNTSFEEMECIYHDGYAEGIIQCKKGLKLHETHVMRKRFYNVVGYEIDIPEFLSGRPFFFIDETKSKKGQARVVKLSINIFTAASRGMGDFSLNMGTLLGIVDDIERSTSLRFSVVLREHSRPWDMKGSGKEDDLVSEIELNKSVLSDIAIISHPSFIRRINYAWQEYELGYKALNACEIKDESDKLAIDQEKLHKKYEDQESREKALSDEVSRIIKESLKENRT